MGGYSNELVFLDTFPRQVIGSEGVPSSGRQDQNEDRGPSQLFSGSNGRKRVINDEVQFSSQPGLSSSQQIQRRIQDNETGILSTLEPWKQNQMLQYRLTEERFVNRNKMFCLHLENFHELQIDTVSEVRRRLELTGNWIFQR